MHKSPKNMIIFSNNICTNASKNGAAGGDVCVANHEAYLSDTLVFNYQIMGANTVHIYGHTDQTQGYGHYIT